MISSRQYRYVGKETQFQTVTDTSLLHRARGSRNINNVQNICTITELKNYKYKY